MSILHGLLRLNFILQPSYFLLRFVRRDRSSELGNPLILQARRGGDAQVEATAAGGAALPVKVAAKSLRI
jgi:hypothetical protein